MKAAIIIFVLAALALAYFCRITAVPAGNGWAALVTDRWTGKVYICAGNQCTQTYPPGPTTAYVGNSK